jgi:hypothetical protein
MSFNILSLAKKFAKSLKDKAIEYAPKIWDKVKKNIPAIWEFAKPLISTGISAMTGIPPPLVGGGLNMLETGAKAIYNNSQQQKKNKQKPKSKVIVEEVGDDEEVGERGDYDIIKYKDNYDDE